MKRQEVLGLFKLKTLPSKVDKLPKGVRGIAKVSRDFGDDDFAIYEDGRCVKDKGFKFGIKSVVQYYYDAPKKEEVVVDKLAELQKMAEEAQIKINKGERPTSYADMIAYIKEHKLTDKKTFGMSKDKASELISEHFA